MRFFLAKVAGTRLVITNFVATTASESDSLLALASLSFVLLNHEIDRFLCVIKVKLVVLGLLLLLRLLIVIDVVFRELLLPSLVQKDRCAIRCFRFAQAAFGPTKDFLLELHLLPKLLSSLATWPVIAALVEGI